MHPRHLNSSTLFSIIVPVFNEQESLDQLFERLIGVADSLTVRCEIILVNDGSRDASLSMMCKMVDRDPRFRIVDLSRNFGHQLALSAGYGAATGHVVGVIDADLQDPPELFTPMLKRWQEGVDVVYGVRTDRVGETAFKLWTARFFYKILSWLSDVQIPPNAGDFRIVDRCVIDVINDMPERHRFLRGMIAWAGFRQEPFPYRREQRRAGTTKYPFWSMVRLSADAIVSFSVKPLQLMIYVGMIATGIGICLSIYYVAYRIFMPNALVPGFSALIVTLLILFGINFVFMGILASYVGRSYTTLQARPIYIIREVHEHGTISRVEKTGDNTNTG